MVNLGGSFNAEISFSFFLQTIIWFQGTIYSNHLEIIIASNLVWFLNWKRYCVWQHVRIKPAFVWRLTDVKRGYFLEVRGEGQVPWPRLTFVLLSLGLVVLPLAFVCFGLVYLFNGTSTPYGLYNTENWFICKGLVWFICLRAHQLLMGYIIQKIDLFVKVGFGLFV